MVIGSTMSAERKKKIIADLEAQGATARETKKGIMIFAPDKNDMRTISAISGDVKGLRDDIAWFRKHGLHHPADRKEMPVVAKPALTNEEGYPMYVVGPINGTTRKRVLSELEKKGWPLRVRPTELTMDTVTATRALYNVGYRWDTDSPAKARVWVAPDDIKEMHERVKAEMDRREQEAREARAAHHEAMAGHENVEDQPVQVVKTDSVLAAVQEARSKPVDLIPEVPVERYRNPGPTIAEAATPEFLAENTEPRNVVGRVTFQEKREDDEIVTVTGPNGTSQVVAKVTPDREFIDSVDSWTVDEHWYLPREVSAYLEGLRGAGLEVEIRVWRNR